MFNTRVLKEARAERGMSREHLASSLGIGLTTLFRYERGESEPLFSVGMRMAELLEIEPAALLTEDPIPTGVTP